MPDQTNFIQSTESWPNNQNAQKYAEQKRISGRMKTALLKDPKANEAWMQICNLPLRAGKQAKKTIFLFSYRDGLEKDKEPFAKSFWSEVEEIIVEDTRLLDGVWVTRGRLANIVGEEEAEESIANKEHAEKVGKDGRTPRQRLFGRRDCPLIA